MVMIIKIKILVAGSSVDGSCIWTATVREESCYGVDGSHLIMIVMILNLHHASCNCGCYTNFFHHLPSFYSETQSSLHQPFKG